MAAGSIASAFPDRLVASRVELRLSDPAFAPQFAGFIENSMADLGFVSGWRTAADVAVATDSLQRSLDLGDVDVVRHAFHRSTGEYVGRLDLHNWNDVVPRCTLGYIGNSRSAGQGLMREAALAMLDAAWGLDVRRIEAFCDTRNNRSIHFATIIGMQREGTLRSYDRDSEGRLCDSVILAITRP